MDELLRDIQAYADTCGLTPGTVIQRAAGASGGAWQRWLAGGSCSVRTADRIRAYMAANPPRDEAAA